MVCHQYYIHIVVCREYRTLTWGITDISAATSSLIIQHTQSLLLQCFQMFLSDVTYKLLTSISHVSKGFIDNYVTSQYFQCWPFFFFNTTALEDWQQVVNEIKVWGVSWPWTLNISMFYSPSHSVIILASWQGAPPCWNCSWMLHSEDVLVQFFIQGCVLRWEWAQSLAEKHEWPQGAELSAWPRTDGSAHLFFSRQAFFRKPQIIRKGIYQRKGLSHSPQPSNPCTFLEFQSVPDVFPGEK